jgi:sucrose phosphorylase
VLITETNVPHRENITYFGTEEFPEAQLVYNFTLPPLLFHALHTGDAKQLADWINTLTTPRENTTFFNFTASHDGIGVRPLEGILNPTQIANLIGKVESSGGMVSYKTNADGTRSPYELNITYVDAIIDPIESIEMQAQKFLVSQGIMLAMAGVPAIYIHSLLGSHNDLVGLEKLGYPRAINREKLSVTKTVAELDQEGGFRSLVFHGYTHLIRTRIQCPAFNPKAQQEAFSINNGSVFALRRSATNSSQHLLCLFNLTHDAHRVSVNTQNSIDLLTSESCDGIVILKPYQIRWLQY